MWIWWQVFVSIEIFKDLFNSTDKIFDTNIGDFTVILISFFKCSRGIGNNYINIINKLFWIGYIGDWSVDCDDFLIIIITFIIDVTEIWSLINEHLPLNRLFLQIIIVVIDHFINLTYNFSKFGRIFL